MSYSQIEFSVEHKTCDILAAERLRLMIFDNDKVSANSASCKSQSYEKSDGSQNACRGTPDIPNEPPD